MEPDPFVAKATSLGWRLDLSIPIQDHAFYEQRWYWVQDDWRIMDEFHLRKELGFLETVR